MSPLLIDIDTTSKNDKDENTMNNNSENVMNDNITMNDNNTSENVMNDNSDNNISDNTISSDIDELYKEYVNFTENIGNYLWTLNIFQTCSGYANTLNPAINNIGRLTMDVTASLTNTIKSSVSECFTTDNNDLRDLANRVKKDKNKVDKSNVVVNTNIMRDVEVKVELGLNKNITKILIKKSGNRDYIQVPFEATQNPVYIQNIIDTWFDNHTCMDYHDKTILAKPSLYVALYKRYQNSRRSQNPTWYSTHVEWLKFKCVNDTMTPVGYKVFKNMDSELKTPDESFDKSEN